MQTQDKIMNVEDRILTSGTPIKDDNHPKGNK